MMTDTALAAQPEPPGSGGGIIHLFARHPVAANLLMISMIVIGLYSLSKLNKQFLPNFALDYISVRVIWAGASAEDVERSITVPIEQALRNLDDVKEMTSTSTRGLSAILIEYQQDTDMGVALDQVKQFVSNIRHLPTDAEDPVVAKIARHEAVATIILTGDATLEELRPLAFEFERQLLDRGIAKVKFSGMPKQEIAIEVSAGQVQQLGLSLNQIGDRIISQSQDIPAGTVAENEAAREVRVLQRKRNVQDFSSLDVLTGANGQKVTLSDIAQIERRPKENQVEIFYHGKPAILMNLQRTESADALASA
ncbi:MAG TPA: efflux RND transporter permease subunit, partial [Thiotrichales bacterium]|nr:efflux RND transporter permease subunit [Thiotrichales bacterium]